MSTFTRADFNSGKVHNALRAETEQAFMRGAGEVHGRCTSYWTGALDRLIDGEPAHVQGRIGTHIEADRRFRRSAAHSGVEGAQPDSSGLHRDQLCHSQMQVPVASLLHAFSCTCSHQGEQHLVCASSSHCLSLCLTVSHCVSLCLAVSHRVSLSLIVSRCLSLSLIVSRCLSLCLTV